MNLEALKQAIALKEHKAVIAVANAVEASVFRAAQIALDESLAEFHFIGALNEMTAAMEEADFSADENTVVFIDCRDEAEASEKAVRLVSEGKADVLMKGMVSTSILLKAVLHKEYGLRSGNVLSHVAGFTLPDREKMLFLTDAAMNIAPSLPEKVQIVENAVAALNQMGIENPKVAVLAAVENVNPAMQATVDAALLTQMNKRQQITNCIVDGPLGFDNAVSLEAARKKQIESPVAGEADLLLAPQIETGNALYKSFTYIGRGVVGGMIVGAKAPIILTSRTDSEESKLFSLAMAVSIIQ
ncbi:bifunctional enoyl-CoA hydratase/phosphate acetyltransferase [Alkalicoccus halolimnae]|uniref:Bifunctional enoyl-CoA hydratase/phosphate acetyltransferase n=1 Tax=Alkalicoccus halolimnae TaxID=1667239 RepID=A0A5C7FNQ8_9BACI|nr:bifunctional enoyl-CoA hydratase/phosphate acetyltransferase [Alkalicoccus halolimnae]TXF86355.1 bifunctional enoyl-CoA hydratase/phosphate acetyltransferase [Alkalicoccus halolimnae]